MSMHTWTVSGIGFELFTGDNYGKIFDFLKGHKDVVKDYFKDTCRIDIDEFFEKADDTWSEMDDEEREDYIRDGLDGVPAPVIAHIINSETGYTGFVGEPGDEEQSDTVLWEPYYPWQMSESDKALTEEKLREILQKYAEKLGIPADNVCDQTLIYCG